MAHPNFESMVTEFGHAVGQLSRRVRAAGASQGLSWNEAAVLSRLDREGPTTTADLARAEGMRPQSMRTIVSELEEMGLVERRPHPTDGRQVYITLTTKGTEVRKNVGAAKRTWLAFAISQLSKQEQETLFAAGEIMARMVKEEVLV